MLKSQTDNRKVVFYSRAKRGTREEPRRWRWRGWLKRKEQSMPTLRGEGETGNRKGERMGVGSLQATITASEALALLYVKHLTLIMSALTQQIPGVHCGGHTFLVAF